MPGKIKVKVLAGRNLPVMDRAGDTTDAFVEIKFGGVTHKTDVCRKSLNPHWNSTEWYRFEVDESELQDEPLQLRLMDHDTYSANDAIGKVVISLSPLLAREPAQNVKGAPVASGGAVMSGWIPVFDTMHGIRGELNVIVKVELFSDFNKYKTSSCGVQFFHCPTIPPGYRVTTIHGFVEELVVNDDPEYQWIDKIRTPRASNEARQVAFIKLSNQVQRLVGLKAAELGANAVVGYQQDFDLEAEAGVVARAIGTAVSIVPLPTPSQPLNAAPCSQQSERDRDKEKDKCEKDKGSPRHARHESCGGKELASSSGAAQNSSLNASSTPVGMHRRSSDSDLSVTPKGSSLNASTNAAGSGGGAILRPSMNSNNLDMLDHPFLTMTEYPYGFVVHIGGTVCARSVKLVDSGGESASRAAWWAELRTELRAHMRALRCNAVTAYTESAAICEDVCVLSVSGTAVVINLDCDFNAGHDSMISVDSGSKNTIEELECEACSIAHLPYTPGSGPYRAELSACAGCRRARVPAVLLATCSKPSQLVSYGKAITLTAVAARVRRAPPNSEPGARDISDQMPFLEYELYKLLQAKLRMQGANALFNLHTQISIGERCVMALATGIAYKLASLPPPTPPRIKGSENDKDALEIQKSLLDTFAANKTSNGYDVAIPDPSTNGVLTELDKEDAPMLDLCADKDACLLELDETEDVETARSLSVRRVHMQVYERGMAPIPGANPHAFVQVCRGRFPLSGGGAGATSVAERVVCKALDTAQYKLRRLRPAALVATRVTLELPEDEIQLVLTGTAIPLEDPSKQDLNVSHIQEQGSAHGRHVHNSSYGRSSYHGSHGHSQISHVHGHSSNGQSSHGHGHSSHAQSSHGHGQSAHVHGHSSHGQSSHSHGQSSHSHGQSSHGHGHSSHSHGSGHGDADDAIFALDEEHGSPTRDKIDLVEEKPCNAQAPTSVCVTSLSSVAGARVSRRICALRLLFVRETTAVRELGGLSGFLHTTTCEVLAIVRAYTAALGGNALTSYYITQLMIQDNAHKNQGQCLLSVGGDVVHVTY